MKMWNGLKWFKTELNGGVFEQSNTFIFDKSREFLPSSADISFALEYTSSRPIPVAARSKAWFCGCSLAGIVSSNSAGGMDVCLL
jgi:hypothetical protein